MQATSNKNSTTYTFISTLPANITNASLSFLIAIIVVYKSRLFFCIFYILVFSFVFNTGHDSVWARKSSFSIEHSVSFWVKSHVFQLYVKIFGKVQFWQVLICWSFLNSCLKIFDCVAYSHNFRQNTARDIVMKLLNQLRNYLHSNSKPVNINDKSKLTLKYTLWWADKILMLNFSSNKQITGN